LAPTAVITATAQLAKWIFQFIAEEAGKPEAVWQITSFSQMMLAEPCPFRKFPSSERIIRIPFKTAGSSRFSETRDGSGFFDRP
jgi:hypothetical protein